MGTARRLILVLIVLIALAASSAYYATQMSLSQSPIGSWQLAFSWLAVGLTTSTGALLLVVIWRSLGRTVQVVRRQLAALEGRLALPGPPDEIGLIMVDSHDELGMMVAEFNRYLTRIKGRTEQLKLQKRELDIQIRVSEAEKRHTEAIIFSISDAVLVTDSFDELILANEAAERTFGFSMTRMYRQPISRVINDPDFVKLVTSTREGATNRDEKRLGTPSGDAGTRGHASAGAEKDAGTPGRGPQSRGNAIGDPSREGALNRDQPRLGAPREQSRLGAPSVVSASRRLGVSASAFGGLGPSSGRRVIEYSRTVGGTGQSSAECQAPNAESNAKPNPDLAPGTRHSALVPEKRTFNVTLSPVSDSRGGCNGVVAVLHDITREKEVAAMKTDFVSNVSHELRTPLSSIKAYVEMLIDGEAQDEQTKHEFYDIIQSETDRLGRLIDNILNISRIESGVVKIHKEPLALTACVKEAIEVARPQALAKRLTLVEDLAPVFYQVLADRDMIYQAVLNLLSNAVKYTPAGGTVTVRTVVDEGNKMVRTEIKDTGVGISQEDLPRVFEKFFRVEASKRMAKGTGLGLSLVKHIVETVHGGEVGVFSQPGKGSTFYFQLKLAE